MRQRKKRTRPWRRRSFRLRRSGKRRASTSSTRSEREITPARSTGSYPRSEQKNRTGRREDTKDIGCEIGSTAAYSFAPSCLPVFMSGSVVQEDDFAFCVERDADLVASL